MTTFRGKNVASGKKSLTLRLRFRDQKRTLTHDEVNDPVASVIELLAEHGADLNVTNDRDESPLTLAEPVVNVSPDGTLLSTQSARSSIGELLRRLGAESH